MGAGHASTSIGYAVGLKEGMKHLGADEQGKVVAVIGDGSMTGGVAFEAIHQAGGQGTPIVVVLNDNGMSISPNVGAMSRYFNRVRLNPKLWHTRESVEDRLTELPGRLGPAFERLGPQIKESIKAFWAPGLFWEELDWAYVGVIDGHDIRALRRALSSAFAADRPVVVHVKTVKGKGFAPAEDGGLEGMERWHAAKPNSISNGIAAPAPAAILPVPPPQYTAVFGDALVAECRRDRRVVGITAAMNSGTGLNILQKAMPDRYFDVGIAEQQAILFAAGLCARRRQARRRDLLDVPAARVRPDRPRRLPAEAQRRLRAGPRGPRRRRRPDAPRRLRHRLPAPAAEHRAHGAARRGDARAHAAHGAAVRRRADRAALPARRRARRGAAGGPGADRDRHGRDPARGRRQGRDRRLRQRRRARGLDAARVLAEHGIHATVADARFAKPIDAALMARLAAEHELLVTVEEGVLAGGFGSAVWEALNDLDMVDARIMRVGLPDRYVTHGTPAMLYEEVGFTGRRIAERILSAVGERAIVGR